MANSFTFPSAAKIMEIERAKTIVIDQQTVGSQILPVVEENADTILWEIRDNVTGLMLGRNAEEPYPVQKDSGITRFSMNPGRFGEQRRISEQYIERARTVGTFDQPIDVTTEAARMMDEIAFREFSLIEYLRWQLLATGTVSVSKADGTTEVVARYPVVPVNASTAWTTYATATPIADFRTLRDDHVGFGFDFGSKARAYASSKTWNSLLANTNGNDFGGRKGFGLTPINGINMFNQILSEAEDIPTLVAVNDGYLSSSSAFSRYIPDGYIVVVGYHPMYGLRVGDYVMTRNGSNMGVPGTYAAITETAEPPVLPIVTRGHNGGPRVNYTKQVVVLQAY